MPAIIMVIDDSPELRAMYTALLTGEGYRVHACDCSEGGLAQVRTIGPQVVILDGLFYHTWTSLDLIAALRATPEMRTIGIILCTAAVAQVAKQADRLRGMQVTVLAKPFEIEELFSAIRNGLAEARSAASVPALCWVG